jgi:hypothetical protein
MSVLPAIACSVFITNLQPKPDAEPKKAVSATSFRDELVGQVFLLLKY